MNTLWDFVSELYAHEAVKRLCLGLQRERGANVNLVLFCCWLAKRGQGALSVQELQRLIKTTALWREEITLPLRRVRQRCQNTRLQKFREQIMPVELFSERVELSQLANVLIKPHRPGRKMSLRAQDALESLNHYAQCLGVLWSDEELGGIKRMILTVFPELKAERVAEKI